LRAAFEAKFGVLLRGSYGMTEAPGPVAMERVGRSHRPGCSGTALPHVAIGVDEQARLVITASADGPFAGMFKPPLGTWTTEGLRSWPDATTLRTEDHGVVEADGELRVTGRASGTIVRGGVNVRVDEVEAVLSELPGVREIAIVGEPDERLGERIVAFVERRAGLTCDVAKLRAQASELLSHGKVPDEFVVVDALPRNAMGKVQRPRLLASRSVGERHEFEEVD
jgi:malonyl-CoA/methylmalonyl-CoA synthetase